MERYIVRGTEYVFDIKKEVIIARANSLSYAQSICDGLNLLEEKSALEENLSHG